ncbi:MAG TPA: sulfite exporter TauE/SafE family protein [Chloroflexota bacterium]|nr:sulfite exporter TauE/SafE family protein [Chloroflexota bacterium]
MTQKQVPNPRRDAAIGGLAGLAGGLLGVGGGFVLVPLQVLWAKRDQHRAVGTSLAAILPIAVVAAATYYFGSASPQADVRVAVFVAAGGVVGAVTGALAAQRVPDRALKMIVAIVLLSAGLKELYDVLLGTAPHLVGTASASFQPVDYALMTAGGLLIGFVSGLTGVGGGILVVPLLTLGFGIGQRVAQGTSLIAMLPTAAIGAFTHQRNGNVDGRAATWMGIAGMPAAVVGSALALWLPARALGGLFGIFLLIAATRMWPWRADRRAPGPSGADKA